MMMNRMIELLAKDIEQAVAESDRVLVVSHVNPDGDAFGTQFATAAYLRSLAKQVHLVRESNIPEKYRFLKGHDLATPIDDFPSDFTIDTAFVLECPTIERAGCASRFLSKDVKIVNIDHHRDNANFGHINWVDPKASSVGELIYEYFQVVGYAITAEDAENLFTAILTDTGRFRYNSTSARTFQIAGELVAAGANPKKIADNAYFNMSREVMDLTGRAVSSIEFHAGGRVSLMTVTEEMLRATGADLANAEGLVDYTLHCKGVVAGALLKEIDTGHTKVSLRSRDGLDVATIAARFGGGGHLNAAGCTVPHGVDETRLMLIDLLSDEDRNE